MQDEEKILAQTIGRVLKDIRKRNITKYTLFCDENEISSATLDAVEKGKYSPKFYTIFRLSRALGISFHEFVDLLEKELPDNFFEKD